MLIKKKIQKFLYLDAFLYLDFFLYLDALLRVRIFMTHGAPITPICKVFNIFSSYIKYLLITVRFKIQS